MNKKIIILFFIIGMIFIPSYNVEAKTLRELKNTLANLEKSYNENSKKANLTKEQMNSLNNEINNIAASINSIKKEMQQAEQDIIDSQNEINAKEEETDELLKFLQVSSGENVYLEYIFESESYTDFIYRYSIVSQLTEHNEQLMDELKVLIEDLEKKKTNLTAKQGELEVKSNELNSKMVTLRSNLSGYEEEGSTIEEDIRDYKKEIAYYEKLGCSLDQDVSSCVNVQYSNGFRYPISHGTVSSEYVGFAQRLDYSGGSGHHGIDLWFNGIYGEPVHPVANGTVARAGWISGGGNAVYIYHNVNGVQYTSVYMHLSGFGPGIGVGSTVTTDTVIGYAGNTGGYSTGAHLHLGLAYGHCANNFNNNSFNPRNVFNFPSMYGGYFYRQ